MTVYFIEHDDRMYDMGDKYVRGVYLTKEAAEAALSVKRTFNRASRLWDEGHDSICCSVEEREVES